MTNSAVLSLWLDVGENITDGVSDPILDETGDEINDGQFVSEPSSLCASVPVTVKTGNFGNGIKDRVANIGTAKFALYNYDLTDESGNVISETGWYSPDHANCRSGFGLDTRVLMVYVVTVGIYQFIYPVFYGKISAIEPMDGQYGERLTLVTAEDWMAEATRVPVRGLTVQVGQRDDQILTSLLALVQRAPYDTDFSTGVEAYNYALHDELGERTKVIGVLQKLMQSGMGKCYLHYSFNFSKLDILVYRTRTNLMDASIIVATLDNSMQRLTVRRRTDKRIKRVTTVTYPSQVDASDVVLWTLQKEITLLAGASYTFTARFRDPSGKSTRVAAASLATLLAGTDYSFSSSSGSGTDLNANLLITVALGADQADVTITNSAPIVGYLWQMQLRGKGIYLYEPIEHIQETEFEDGDYLTVDMPYQDDFGVGDDVAVLLKSWYDHDTSEVESVEFMANINEGFTDVVAYGLSLYRAAGYVEVGDLVSIHEAQTGIYGTYFVNGIERSFIFGANHIMVRWALEKANLVQNLFYLDIPGSCELDSTPVLGV